jgi:hypothetical protein
MVATPSFDEPERYLRELTAFLSIPSVSRDPARRDDVRAPAGWVADMLAWAGGRVVAVSFKKNKLPTKKIVF